MIIAEVPEGFVRALVERPANRILQAVAEATLRGAPVPTDFARDYRDLSSNFQVDPTFGAIAIGGGASANPVENSKKADENAKVLLKPKNSKKFLVSGFVKVGREGVPSYLDGDVESPVHSDPVIGGLLSPCRPTCGSSQAVGTAVDVANKLDAPRLHARGFDGSGVGLAIVDSGIYLPRITRPFGPTLPKATPPRLDRTKSWRPPGLVTKPGENRVGHGTMCAFDALIMAPKATLLDFPMLLARQTGDHRSSGTVAAAILAYLNLLAIKPSFDTLVVSNSWGLFHPSLEDFQPGQLFRFIDNPTHIFTHFISALTQEGADVIFCGNNCGNGTNCAGACASGTCLSKTDRMIMGANAYEDVLTIGGCDTNDEVVGYSSRGPSIANMFQEKPDLVAYTHFFGSTARPYKIGSRTGTGGFVPDTGVSAACPVAAGCVAALRTKIKPSAVPPGQLFRTLKATAYKPTVTSGWDPDFGYGVIRPVAAARALGQSIP